MSAPLRAHPTTIGGVATRVVCADGEPGRPRFLFLHGFADSADCWQRVQRRLAAAGYGSTAVDQPSHGFAGPLDPDRPVIEQFVSFAAAAARATDDGAPVVVVGNSLGGAHALLLAERHPELLHGVVAVSPAAFDHPGWFRLLDGPRLPIGAEHPVVALLGRTMAGPAVRAVGFGMPHRVPRGFVRTWASHWGDSSRRRALQDLGHRIPAEYFGGDLVDLRAVDVPVMALWGTRDRLTLISSRARFERDCRDLEFVPLPGVGHLPQVEVPGRTTKHLVRFADRVAAGRAVDLAA